MLQPASQENIHGRSSPEPNGDKDQNLNAGWSWSGGRCSDTVLRGSAPTTYDTPSSLM
jgi:hypothetical protein